MSGDGRRWQERGRAMSGSDRRAQAESEATGRKGDPGEPGKINYCRFH